MSGLTDLRQILERLEPVLAGPEYVYCREAEVGHLNRARLQPFALVNEAEGCTLVLERKAADHARLAYSGVFRRITLQVHSSLHAVGLTAAVASALAERNIAANVIAGFHHDHVLVPAEHASTALAALQALSCSAG